MSATEGRKGEPAKQAYLLPPPRLLPHGELPPIIEPALRGVPAFDGPRPDHFEPFEAEELETAVSDDSLERIRQRVMADTNVREQLGGERFEWIGVSVLDEKAVEETGEGPLVAVLYSYDRNRAVEVQLDRDGETVQDVSVRAYQPPPTDGEIRRAIEIASAHQRVSEHVGELEGTAILISPPNTNQRLFDIRFGCPNERLPRFMATVDLSRQSVVRVGSCSPHDLGESASQREVGS